MKALVGLAPRLSGFCRRYAKRFKTCTRTCAVQAILYLRGLVQAPRKKKNMERMVENVADADYQAMQQFITDSPWDASGVFDQVALDANVCLPRNGNRRLALDESSFTKKGEDSVGVARQWNGRLGKVDNCQVGVFASFGVDTHDVLVNAKLYLPEEWTTDRARCKKAKIPAADQVCVPKHVLALRMVAHARELGLEFDWVAADGGYGHIPAFLCGLAEMGETFMVDVHSDQGLYLAPPQPYVPAANHLGRPPSRRVSQVPSVEARTVVASTPESAWKTVRVRETTKGWLETRYLRLQVWHWDGQEAEARELTLVIREDKNADGSSRLKYSLSNAAIDTPLERLALMQGERFWIEDTFHNGKGSLGMADYQTRKWRSWHHHMALVAMALQFMLEERVTLHEIDPLISCNDIVEILAWLLPKQAVSTEDIIDQILKRHRQRQESIDFAHREKVPRNNTGKEIEVNF